jgi:chromosome segregation ATPase
MATVEMEVGSQSGPKWKSPLRKLAGFFKKSRDRWKDKYFTKKEQYKRMGNQARAVEKSRAKWRAAAEQAQEQARQLERELEQYKKCPT